MDWTTYFWIAFLSSIVFVALGDAVWNLVWLWLLYAVLHSTVDWYYAYIAFMTIFLYKKFTIGWLAKIK